MVNRCGIRCRCGLHRVYRTLFDSFSLHPIYIALLLRQLTHQTHNLTLYIYYLQREYKSAQIDSHQINGLMNKMSVRVLCVSFCRHYPPRACFRLLRWRALILSQMCSLCISLRILLACLLGVVAGRICRICFPSTGKR